MDNQKTALSYRARLNAEPMTIVCKQYAKRRLRQSSFVDDDTHRVVYKTEYAVEDNNKLLSKFRVNDFSLETMQAVGVHDNSLPCLLSYDVQTSQSIIESSLLNSKTLNSK